MTEQVPAVVPGDVPAPPFSRWLHRLQLKNENVGERPVIYTAFGDSVTQGWYEHATCDNESAFPTVFKRFVDKRYPAAPVNLINSGVAGDTAVRSLNRAERDMLMFQPDLVTIGFGVNDAHGGAAGVEPFKQAVTELIRLVRDNGDADILLLTPAGMMTEDNAYIHPNEKRHVEAFLRVAQAGSWELYHQAMLEVAFETETPCLDVSALWLELGQSGADPNARLSNGINHPDRAFHYQVAEAMERIIFN